jgi:peptidoglycan hydrolase-like protein with peptidoglycan-binding domain
MPKSRTSRLPTLLVAAALAAGGAVESALADGGSDGSGGVQVTKDGVVYVKQGDRGPAVRQIQSALGIGADGVFGPGTERAVKRFQRRKGLVPDGVVGPITRRALGLRPFARDSIRRTRSVALPRVLRRIAKCESGGDPRSVSSDGRYRGKYQFTRGTWRRLGGRGDPARAPEWLQDRMALKLYRLRGTAPWPSCSRSS